MKNASSTITLIEKDHGGIMFHDEPAQTISKAELHQKKIMLSTPL